MIKVFWGDMYRVIEERRKYRKNNPDAESHEEVDREILDSFLMTNFFPRKLIFDLKTLEEAKELLRVESEDEIVIFVTKDPEPKKNMLAALYNSNVERYFLETPTIPKIRQMFQEQYGWDRRITDCVLDRIGYAESPNWGLVTNEIKKLEGMQTVTKELVQQVVLKSAVTSVFDITKALFHGDYPRAFVILKELKEQPSFSGIAFISLLEQNFRVIFKATLYEKREDALKEIGVKYIPRSLSKEKAAEILVSLSEMELTLKSGILSDEEAADKALLSIASILKAKKIESIHLFIRKE